MPRNETDGRIVGLDGLRAVSLILVLQAHWGPSKWFSSLAEWGRGGLIIFFVLSGFLITRILLDPNTTIGSFYARRAFRIFPVYYAALAFVLVMHLNDAVSQDWAWHALFLNNISNVLFREDIGVYGAAFPWWSLAVEEQFYCLWAPLVLFLPRRWLPAIAIAALIGGFAFRLINWTEGVSTGKTFILTLSNIDSLAAGAVAAILSKKANRYHTGALILMALAIGAFAWSVADRLTVGYAAFRLGFNGSVTNDVIWYVLFSSLVYLLATDGLKSVGAALDNPVLKYIGQRSYGAYVVHHVVATVLYNHYPSIGRYGPVAFIIYFLATMLLAMLSFRFLEQPIMRMRERLFPSLKPHSTEPTLGRPLTDP